MKVAYLIDTIVTDTAGTQKQLLETIRRLDRNEVDPLLICLYESPWMRGRDLPCPCVVLGYRGFLDSGFTSVLRKLSGVLEAEKVEVLQTFFEDSIFVAWLATRFSRYKPALLSSRRDIGLGAGNHPWYHHIFRAILPWVNCSFEAIIVNSERVKEHVCRRERTKPEKVLVHYNGVDLPAPESGHDKPAPFSAYSPDLWVVIVASLTPVKRHDVLVRAVALARKDSTAPDIRTVVLGEGPEMERLQALATSLGIADAIHFEGNRKDVSTYLACADIGVLCSDREGLSNAILEYMANSLPVVATNVGGTPELVSDRNGSLVPAGDAEALATALIGFAMDPQRRRLAGLESRRIVERNFSWPASLNCIVGHYRSVLASRRGK